MAGLGKLLKQIQKAQRQNEAIQAGLEATELAVTSGGGAIKIKITGAGKFLALELDPEFLKEDAKFVADTLLAAIQEASAKAREQNEAEMKKLSEVFQMPGLM
ncbi:MAG: YbaB/EbfC family nucleoid-associated protein [Opitutaceae bacterium]|jgi:DNA-binding YbaB/EbfC family protein|nr:YbaB/EbfC family nucleoid-associated protein [Opitutaceae bacterium]